MRKLIVAAVFLLMGSIALGLPTQGGPWEFKTQHGPDAKAGGWFINLGITGARAVIDVKQPRSFRVAYVFPDTPAAGKLLEGDRITGIAGSVFTEHRFGYGPKFFGYDGPIASFGDALEACQGGDGKLVLNVQRGKKSLDVTLELPTKYGSFAKSYPVNCVKSARILNETCDYLVKEQKGDGSWTDRCHINAMACLALMGSEKKRHRPAVAKAVKFMANQLDARVDRPGYPCWEESLYGIVLAEYYLNTKEAWVLDELKEVNQWLKRTQAPRGGWGHNRWVGAKADGYGPICAITGQSLAAWALIKRCGIAVDAKAYDAAHRFIERGTNKIGYVWYADDNAQDPNYADMGRTGVSALAHYLSPEGGDAYREFAMRNAKCIGTHTTTFSDTHGAPLLGMAWTALGAHTHPPSFRRLMNDNRWWFAMAHCPDGTFYYQPNRDNNPQDFCDVSPRLSATAAVALILSIRSKNLQCTGAPLVTP